MHHWSTCGTSLWEGNGHQSWPWISCWKCLATQLRCVPRALDSSVGVTRGALVLAWTASLYWTVISAFIAPDVLTIPSWHSGRG